MPASEPRSSAAGAPWTSYSEDGTIFGLPDSSVQLEFVRSTELAVGVDRVDMLVLSLPDAAAQERFITRMGLPV
jgi:hypothetical protein